MFRKEGKGGDVFCLDDGVFCHVVISDGYIQAVGVQHFCDDDDVRNLKGIKMVDR